MKQDRAGTWMLGGLACLWLAAPATGADASDGRRVAVVCGLSGKVWLQVPDRPATELRLLDWLPSGARVEAKAGARAVIIFRNGRRYEVNGKGWAVLGSKGVTSSFPGLRAQEPPPSWPVLLAAIREDERAGPRAAVVRVRGRSVRGLWPAGGAATLADHTTLRFTRVSRAAAYEVEVQARDGSSLFRVRTEEASVSVPAGVLAPAGSYYWTVRTVDPVGPSAKGEASFRTLEAEVAGEREAMAAAVAGAQDPAARLFLAALDLRIGLLSEARARLEETLRAQGPSSALLEARAAVDRSIRERQAD
jgi:hypothetical protein